MSDFLYSEYLVYNKTNKDKFVIHITVFSEFNKHKNYIIIL